MGRAGSTPALTASKYACVMELVYMLVLETSAPWLTGSNPVIRIKPRVGEWVYPRGLNPLNASS